MLFLLSAADASIGRIDKSTLPQQTLMELFIGKITQNRKGVCGDSETPWDIGSWFGVDRNASDEVTDITWGYFRMGGSVQLEWLPDTVTSVFLNNNRFEGTVCLTSLPVGLLKLSLSYNRFVGTIDVSCLPRGMIGLFLNNNMFEGETDFTQIPESLKLLWVSQNSQLSGTLVVKQGKDFQHWGTAVELQNG
eukprot:CAMPEP_0201509066 /NCGR_PEP_ID=MMETSP0161_2-20130828/2229_1 /ASSEMBLY_ACC=CAM_ASM_000251 /TAXON_ID=180227 /ORGANISM="Neoparamoeba aestuarina, Strain SoJaBio B1-5/56/2" /LENGTH=191 /DNA_ID=CAMNT_0047903913 /DNA_START=24 /DNA_END=599 /DNA_ORIENTATION=+